MSIYPLDLPGWEDLSTWGIDCDHFYAQLTRNGQSDDDGPEFWITPPRYPAYRTTDELGHAISSVTGADEAEIQRAMGAGVEMAAGPDVRRALDLPAP